MHRRSAQRGYSCSQSQDRFDGIDILARNRRIGSLSANGGFGAAQQKGLRERISPICTLSQNGYGALGLTCLISLFPRPALAAGCQRSRNELETPAATIAKPLGLPSLRDAYITANTAYEADCCDAAVSNLLRLFSAPARKLEGPCRSILAEGAIALSVTLSGGALFAS